MRRIGTVDRMFEPHSPAAASGGQTTGAGPAAALLERLPDEVPQTWDLESLAARPGTDAFTEHFATLQTTLAEVEAAAAALPAATSEHAATWGAFLQQYAQAIETYHTTISLVGCWAAADAANETYQQYEGRLAALAPTLTRIRLAIELAMRELDDASLDALTAADERLATNRYALEQARKDGRLRLPREQEELLAELSVDGLKAWSRLYDRLSGQLRVTVLEDGRIVEKSPGQVEWNQTSRTERANNFHAFRRAWEGIGETCGEALNHIAGARLTKAKRLGVDHLELPLRLNRLQRGTLEQMFAVVAERRPVLLDFFAAKARWLDLDALTLWDLRAPLPLRGVVSRLSYSEACRTVVETLGEFSEPFGQFAAEAIRDRWIEAEDRAGKRQGGFCTDLGAYRQSRIFMTYTGTTDAMSTLAHELGHAYHTFVLRDEPTLLQDYPMNLAETASTFAEAVVGDRRLADAATTSQQLGVLDGLCVDAVAYLMNLPARFLFEDGFYKRRAEGEFTVDELSALMLEAQREAYCNGLANDGYYPSFWISKLHFYIDSIPFYNFPYTFGYLLSLGLFTLGKQQDAGEFAERFRRFLVLTGCRETEAAVAESFGHDLSEPTFWHLALDAIEERVQAFVAATDEELGSAS